jgi:hypothetical protein
MRKVLLIAGLMIPAVAVSAVAQVNAPTANSTPSESVLSNNVSSAPASSITLDPAPASTGTRTLTYDPLLDPPPLPHNRVSLVGGTVTDIDTILNRITILPYGSRKDMRFAFDLRSRIDQDGKSATARDIRTGERVYVDGMLDGSRLFAKSISIRSRSTGIGYGQIVSYDARSQALTVRDQLSDAPIRFNLSPTTVIRNGTETRSAADLVPGSLVSLEFGTQQGALAVREVSLIAKTGSTFLFVGNITFVDLARKLIAVYNQSDGKTYEIILSSVSSSVIQDLHAGRQVVISAVFDGTQYVAQSITHGASSPNSQ